MNGRTLTLGLIGALALAGAVRKRGSATQTTPVKTVPVERFWTIPDKLEETLQDVAEGRRSYSYDAPLRVSALDTPRGHYFVLDGHHRLVEHLQAGDRTVAVKLDPYTPRIERTGGAHQNMVARKVNIAARVRRGSASLEAWPNADALARTFTDTMADATAQQMGRWAKKNGLVYIGSGQSRAVFAEPDGTRVLKLVFSFFGREANRDEARAWREASPAMRPHLVPVLAADPMGSWLVMERVKPMRATQHIPKGTMDALKGCGFLDLRRPNFAADGRLLDYGSHIWFLWKDGCRAEGSAARDGAGTKPISWKDYGFSEMKIGPTTVQWWAMSPNEVTLMGVRTPRTHRKKGAARNALQTFLEEADRRGATVDLIASPLDTSTSLSKLTAFYERLGFVRTGESCPRTGNPMMRRSPRRQQ